MHGIKTAYCGGGTTLKNSAGKELDGIFKRSFG
jgi:hypothetical protein